MPARKPLTDADVNALFAGVAAPVGDGKAKCDNCGIRGYDVLEFGGDSGFEMPVDEDGALETELEILRHRLERHAILLCYSCTDALQTPLGGHRDLRRELTTTPSRSSDNPLPRLFDI